jgi:hypothetical protein|mmetsp:Transcript_18747/g.33924  ORF Transcript_18747/g.33924 Transcript_18747/m.33924 type:complete len:122 (+) Transcript_18747:92-457(+)
MTEEKKLLVLISRGVSDRTQAANQSRAFTFLKAKNTPYIEIDGNDPELREIRNELFEISGIRGNYPQFFVAFKDGSTKFLGDFEKLELLNDNSALPEDVLENHPEIETWDSVLGNVVSSFS